MSGARWRASLVASLGWTLAAKIAALALIWALFFAPARITPTGATTGAHFGLDGGRNAAAPPRTRRKGGPS